MQYIILNKQLINAEEAKISPQDRGFRYGDGIFETMLVRGGEIYQWKFHLYRFTRGLEAIKIAYDTNNLLDLCKKLLTANKVENGILRLQITRGIGGRGYLPDVNIQPTLVIETMDNPKTPELPVCLWISSYSKITQKSLPVYAKLCQGMNSTLARMEAAEKGCFDGLFLNERGIICETSSANIFWLRKGVLYTPALSCGVLEGSIRNAVMRLSPYKIQEVAESIDILASAEAVFITNTAYRVMPVRELKPSGISWDSNSLAEEMLQLVERDITQQVSA